MKFFGMSLVFEASWVVMLARKEGGPIVLGLMTADHPSKPPGPETFDGKGMIMTFQVEDAAAEHKRLQAAGRADCLWAGRRNPGGSGASWCRTPPASWWTL